MATRSRSSAPVTPRPGWQHPFLLPGVLAVAALLFLLSGAAVFALGFVLGALGALLYLMGKAKRWKGAPEAGLLVCGVAAIIALWALVG